MSPPTCNRRAAAIRAAIDGVVSARRPCPERVITADSTKEVRAGIGPALVRQDLRPSRWIAAALTVKV